MVIEHTFVTTLEAPEALQTAFAFLQERGFSPAGNDSGALLEMSRGKANPARARSVAELPQSIRLDFDRGRIALAAAVTPSPVWGGRSFAGSDVEIRATDSKAMQRMKLHTDMLMGILGWLEKLLVHRAPAEIASQQWAEAEERIAAAARRHKRRNRIALAILVLVVGSIIGLIVASVP
jgi:hypothetical protein